MKTARPGRLRLGSGGPQPTYEGGRAGSKKSVLILSPNRFQAVEQ